MLVVCLEASQGMGLKVSGLVLPSFRAGGPGPGQGFKGLGFRAWDLGFRL